jgi:hypothetical protein
LDDGRSAKTTMLFNLAVLASFVGPAIAAVGQSIRLTNGVPEVLMLLWWGGSLLALARRARLSQVRVRVR